jgi:ABC-type uncharacterized transport system fused permease/ATPase subunit
MNSLLREVLQKVEKKPIAIGSAILLVLLVSEITLTLLLPTWRAYFFDSLAKFNLVNFQWSVIYYIVLMSALTLAQGFKTFVAQKVALYFRTAFTYLLQDLWVGTHVKLDNPCQRINQDTALCTDLTLSVFLEVLISAVLVVALIIATLSKAYILIAALVYTGIVTVGALFFKTKLISTEIGLQKAEADHRKSLTINTLTDKGNFEQSNNFYETVKSAYNKFITVMMNYTFFNRAQNNFSPVIVYLLLYPAYFSGIMSLGSYMGEVTLFELIVINATILIQLFPSVTKAIASWRRINTFYKELK